MTGNFDRIAPWYDGLAALVFGNRLRRAQAQFLHYIPPHSRVLVLGGGSGWLLEQVLRLHPAVSVVYLEASHAMLEAARQRTQPLAHQRVEFRQGTETDLHPQETFDVVLTFFVLDLFTNQALPTAMLRLYQALRPGGHWLFTDFDWPERRPAFWWEQGLIWGMYRFFGVVSEVCARQLPPYRAAFEALPLQCRASVQRGLLHSAVWQKVPAAIPS
ncbi:Methyltransferase domain-containing protein [Catalinimonas alkaloidigena]|uniref:Methyltransferase domain-containing protein n=1 Tax=Catalinimonas alkaloidigena TaxID=1075417 RepID=A0A1G8XAR8_9BACT|nr:class I SAM-dependent methyltransferase [Catalinimonas alkaloidigena]SDJ87514.1 Methyltransferase domain-containing protein [Catalinimonas alkaloidigena]